MAHTVKMTSLNCVIIDDSQFIRESISKIIVETGHTVIGSFEEGSKFLTDLDLLNPDIVFLDIILPNITGLEILEKLQNIRPDIRVIILSGLAQSDAVSAALRLGAIDFLQKPVSKERLITLLMKLSDTMEMPSLEEVSTIGVACMLLTEFFDELIAHSASFLQAVLKQQISSILSHLKPKTRDMFIIDDLMRTMQLDPNVWGQFSEDEVILHLANIPGDLSFEIQFLYNEDYVDNLFNQAIVTMASKTRIARMLDFVPPSILNLPEPPDLGDPIETIVSKAGQTHDELEAALSLAVLHVSEMGPDVLVKYNDHLLTEEEYLRNGIFFFTLIGSGEKFQEGLFGPLPVTAESPVSSLLYATKVENQRILFCIYYTGTAEKIVADYNRLSFILKTRLATIMYQHEVSKSLLGRMLDDIIAYLME